MEFNESVAKQALEFMDKNMDRFNELSNLVDTFRESGKFANHPLGEDLASAMCVMFMFIAMSRQTFSELVQDAIDKGEIEAATVSFGGPSVEFRKKPETKN